MISKKNFIGTETKMILKTGITLHVSM